MGAIADREKLALQDDQSTKGDGNSMPPPTSGKRGRRSKTALALEASPSASDTDCNSPASSSSAILPTKRSKLELYTLRKPSPTDIEAIAQDVMKEHRIEGILDQKGQRADEAAARMQKIESGTPEIDGRPLALASQDGESATPAGEPTPGTPSSQVTADQVESLSDVDDEELEAYLLKED